MAKSRLFTSRTIMCGFSSLRRLNYTVPLRFDRLRVTPLTGLIIGIVNDMCFVCNTTRFAINNINNCPPKLGGFSSIKQKKTNKHRHGRVSIIEIIFSGLNSHRKYITFITLNLYKLQPTIQSLIPV